MGETETRILVVDDDARLRDLLVRYLGDNGFRVRSAVDAPAMDRELQREPPDLIVLDLMLPGEDGLSICRRLRASDTNLPIVMLTARGDEVDRIIGLEMGADDYLPKPFNPRELLARIRAVLRRRAATQPSAALVQGGKVVFGPFTLDLATRQLSRDGETLPLTSGEFSVLKVLVEHARRPSRLRKLIEDSAAQPRYIQTVWGFGYVFVPDGEHSA
ncbi:MAG: response regulator [Betaproteobacteria bacterium]|nr:response regulator [Betaproteobacteria bacterium]